MASDVSAFFDKVNSDPALKAKAKAIGTSDWSKVEAFAKELGFSFTATDMNNYFSKQLGDSNDLSDDDLTSVAGGTDQSTSAQTAAVVLAMVGDSSGGGGSAAGIGW